MSRSVLTYPERRRVPVLYAVAGVLVFAALVAVAWSFDRPISIVVDGTPASASRGTTVARLVREYHLVTAPPGRLLSVTGAVIDPIGGGPPQMTRNGRPAAETQRLFDGDILVSTQGSDAVEASVTQRSPIAFGTRFTGRGPVMRLANPGAVGVREAVVGAVSRTIVSSRTLSPAVDMVVVRTRPFPTEKLIALTFDDGPWPGQTNKILDVLEKEGVKASFFMVGVRVKAAQALAGRVAEDGNLIGSHTLGHRRLTTATPKEVRRQIDGGERAIYEATGVHSTWFRPPWGSINTLVWKQIREKHLHVALWTIDPRDWSRPGVKKIVSRVVSHAKRGSIILLHDGGKNRTQTIKALPQIIRKLKKRGFVFVTLEELTAAS